MADDEKDLASPNIGTMVTGVASAAVLTAAAARAKPGWLRTLLLVFAGIAAAVTLIGIIGNFGGMGGLPGCDDKRTRDTLSDLNVANKFNATKYNFIKNVSTSDTEVVCTANLALKGGSNVEYDYRIYKEAGSVKVKIVEVRK
jgi:hypothetical protein